MSRICKLDIACKHLARTRRTSSTSTRVQEVGQGVTKKRSRVLNLAANRLSSYSHRSVSNPATRKSTELNLGLKELKQISVIRLVTHHLTNYLVQWGHIEELLLMLIVYCSLSSLNTNMALNCCHHGRRFYSTQPCLADNDCTKCVK